MELLVQQKHRHVRWEVLQPIVPVCDGLQQGRLADTVGPQKQGSAALLDPQVGVQVRVSPGLVVRPVPRILQKSFELRFGIEIARTVPKASRQLVHRALRYHPARPSTLHTWPSFAAPRGGPLSSIAHLLRAIALRDARSRRGSQSRFRFRFFFLLTFPEKFRVFAGKPEKRPQDKTRFEDVAPGGERERERAH